MIKNFNTGTGGASGGGGNGSPGASTYIGSSISPSVVLTNLVHMKLNYLYITYTTVFRCYNCINYVNRCIPVYKRSL